MFAIKQKNLGEDPEMFATYLALAQEACQAVRAHRQCLMDQIAHMLSDGVEQGVFEVADVKGDGPHLFDSNTNDEMTINTARSLQLSRAGSNFKRRVANGE